LALTCWVEFARLPNRQTCVRRTVPESIVDVPVEAGAGHRGAFGIDHHRIDAHRAQGAGTRRRSGTERRFDDARCTAGRALERMKHTFCETVATDA